MNSGNRRALTGSIHKVREFELEKVSLVEEFDILQIVGEGWFGKILLVEHRASDTEIVLKALPKPYVSIRDFYREFHYSLHLSAHKNIVTTFDVAFETAGFYVFCQEYAPLGDLTSNMLDTGIGEIHTKRVAKQLAAALEHLHQRDLVHRDVKLDNILIFKSDFSRIKLCDFGETRKVHSAVRRRNEWLPYSPPEVLKLSMDSSYKALITHDVWQFGIVIFICLTGCLPWQKAAFDDPRYTSYYSWYNSSNPLKKQPKLWKMVSSRAQRMFKKLIEPREEKRSSNFLDLSRYYDDRWMAKGYTDRVAGGDIDELCPSMYSFHSDPNEKNILLKHFRDNGIETTVDRQAKKQRIREWIQNSVIEEADEEEEESEQNIYEDSDTELEHRARNHPIDEAHRVTLRFDTEKHINPRTGEVIDGHKQQVEKNPLSYDVQNIEPVAPDNIVRRYGVKEEGSSHSSTKDSAYGSIEAKGNVRTAYKYDSRHATTSIDSSIKNSPSRSLSAISLNNSVSSTMTTHAQRIQRSEEVFSKELENLKDSSSTLHSSRSNSIRATQNSSLDIPSSRSNSIQAIHNSSLDIPSSRSNSIQATHNNSQDTSRSNSIQASQNSSLDIPSSRSNSIQATRNNSQDTSRSNSIQASQNSSFDIPSSRSNSIQAIRNSSVDIPPTVSNDMTSSGENNSSLKPNDPDLTKNGFSPGTRTKPEASPKYVSMKSTVYDKVNTRSETNNSITEFSQNNNQSPYTSMMNIVQGQIKISPHENKVNRNVVNVSVTPVARNKKT